VVRSDGVASGGLLLPELRRPIMVVRDWRTVRLAVRHLPSRRVAELRAAAYRFWQAGLLQFSAGAEPLAAALDHQPPRCARPRPMRPADMIALRVAELQPPTPGVEL
jgi:hypothetical protein